MVTHPFFGQPAEATWRLFGCLRTVGPTWSPRARYASQAIPAPWREGKVRTLPRGACAGVAWSRVSIVPFVRLKCAWVFLVCGDCKSRRQGTRPSTGQPVAATLAWLACCWTVAPTMPPRTQSVFEQVHCGQCVNGTTTVPSSACTSNGVFHSPLLCRCETDPGMACGDGKMSR